MRLNKILQYCLLLVSSLVLGFILDYFHFPAALLIAPMIIGVMFGLSGSQLRVHPKLFALSLALLGTMLAQNFSFSILRPLGQYWFFVVAIIVIMLLMGALAGWLLVRFSSLPGSTAVWGSVPGGAAPMVAMAHEFGADTRLVAFMQYLRIILVTLMAAIVIHLVPNSGASGVVFCSQESNNILILQSIIFAMLLGWLGIKLKIPSGVLLLPMFIGAFLHSNQIVELQTPHWLMTVSYLAIGWQAGLSFNKQILKLAIHTLPHILFMNFVMMLCCAGLAGLMCWYMEVDYLSAFLATSPGGINSIAVLATGISVNMPLVLAIQSLRLFSAIVFGPILAKWLSKKVAVDSRR